MEIDAASHTGVDNVRENIIASTRVAPVRSKYKVFIIDEAHGLSASAFNALLKVMEEPPAYIIFILCTTEAHKVPTTIISRCQRFDFKRISIADVIKKLEYIIRSENIKVDKEVLEAIARQADGHMRDAESILGQVVAIAGEDKKGAREIKGEDAWLVIPRSDIGEVISLLEVLEKKDAGAAIRIINKIINEGINIKNFLRDMIEVLRKIIFIKINPALERELGLEFGEGLEIKINEISRNLEVARAIIWIEKLMDAENKLKDAHIVQLPLELAVIEICLPTHSVVAENIINKYSYSSSAPASSINNSVNQVKQAPTPISPIINLKPMPADFNVAAILSRWEEVLAKVKTNNHSLSFILRACQVKDLRGNELCLAFKYKFHKDRVTEQGIRVLIEKILSEVYNTNITLEAVIDENLEMVNNNLVSESFHVENSSSMENKEPAPAGKKVEDKPATGSDSMIDNLLKTFGGKIIN
jgi:DNA polymerase-3 subunit gamma/tau